MTIDLDSLNTFEREYMKEMMKLIDKGDMSLVNDLYADDYRFPLVTPKEFLEDAIYTGTEGLELFPILKNHFNKIFTTYGIMEVILAGSQRYGKSFMARLCGVRMAYEILALKRPQEYFKIATMSDIYMTVFSINATKAKSEFFDGMKRIFDNSPFFNTYRIKKDLETRVIFRLGDDDKPRGNLIFVSGNSTEMSAFGQNTIAGFLDEANFLPDIKNSKRGGAHGQQSNSYNAALTLYNSVFRRMKNTYGTLHGTLPGKFFIISSQKHEKDFVNTRIEQVNKTKDKSVYIIRHASWETNPKYQDAKTFQVGINHKKTRLSSIITNENINEYEKVIDVPLIFKTDFETDFFGAMCDLAGQSFYGKGKFINSMKIPLIFNKLVTPFTNKNIVDFSNSDIVFDKSKIKHINKPRFAHIDMAESGDNLGVALGYLYGSKSIAKQENGELITVELPIIATDFHLTITPPKNGQIDIDKVYELFLRLKNLGLNIQNIGFDRFQSLYIIQRLSKMGFKTEYLSQDRLPCEGYHELQHAIHQERFYSIDNEILNTELTELETTDTGKIEHISTGSKDLADCLASITFQINRFFISSLYSGQLLDHEIRPPINNNFNMGNIEDFDAW